MATSLLLLCAASTKLSRSGGFPGPADPLDEPGAQAAAACRLPSQYTAELRCSPAQAARETVAAMGLTVRIDPALADIDHGPWAGRAFEDIAPDALAAWLNAPAGGAPGGETLAQVHARAGAWLDDIAAAPGAVCAVTHPMTVRAALAHALGLPLPATLAIDLAPLSRTLLSFNGRWRLQSLIPN
ncbi:MULTISPECIES: histidine phosphatase family protein [unclassified Novosphingobium]|uniref:histidine phosphatase family protein n=1 Tax=unclassified Novosphingobium TaxID=2644732 RepID=UPI001356F89A|nr:MULTISPECIES: histidine phosphatase family protein [unclassified Novosphingobium]